MKRLFRIAFSLIITVIAYLIIMLLFKILPIEISETLYEIVIYSISVIIGILFYIIFSSFIADRIFESLGNTIESLSKMNVKDLFGSLIGVVGGLIIANLIGIALRGYGLIGTGIILLLNIIFGYIGFKVAQSKSDEIIFPNIKDSFKKSISGRAKILDTSVIIDGRILDILQTGFIEGKIIIPNFVLEELRHIADSSDSLKRNRGRRGLDILNEIQKQTSVTVEISDFDMKDISEVDSKLLKMAEKLDAFVITNDFNLNKVAEFQGVDVLNINDLANAIKPVVLPGEKMSIMIIKPGKESGQGIAYLNDGTMIVTEGGSKYIGEETTVTVTSVLQTSAGRMIFTKTHDY